MFLPHIWESPATKHIGLGLNEYSVANLIQEKNIDDGMHAFGYSGRPKSKREFMACHKIGKMRKWSDEEKRLHNHKVMSAVTTQNRSSFSICRPSRI